MCAPASLRGNYHGKLLGLHVLANRIVKWVGRGDIKAPASRPVTQFGSDHTLAQSSRS